jgi:hypothetical protein
VLVALVGALLIAGAAVGTYVLVSSLDSGAEDGGTAAPGGTVVRLTGVAAYDPFGDNNAEHDEDAPKATDGDPATFWRTETYRTFSKDGVGVVLDAGQAATVGAMTVQTDTPGFSAEIQAGGSPTGPFETVGPSQTVADSATFQLDNATARYFVVWITDLGGRDVVHVNEVGARS